MSGKYAQSVNALGKKPTLDAFRALAWTAMVAACSLIHLEFMSLISPLAASIGF